MRWYRRASGKLTAELLTQADGYKPRVVKGGRRIPYGFLKSSDWGKTSSSGIMKGLDVAAKVPIIRNYGITGRRRSFLLRGFWEMYVFRGEYFIWCLLRMELSYICLPSHPSENGSISVTLVCSRTGCLQL